MELSKAVLVLRAALSAGRTDCGEQDGWKGVLALEDHADDHRREAQHYVTAARRVSEWIFEDALSNSEKRAVGSVDNLMHTFLAININAIAIGSNGVGLFPGLSSMSNHSCHENLTHS